MIYLEPAPYIVGLVNNVRNTWRGTVDVMYVGANLTQPWGHEARGERETILPIGFVAAIAEIRRRILSGEYGLVHLAGWGHPILASTLLLASAMGLPVVVESDTPRPFASPVWKCAVKRLLYPWFFLLPKAFLPGGSPQASYLRDYGVAESKIWITQMTVDVARAQQYFARRKTKVRDLLRERFHLQRNAVCFLYIGRLEPYKGIRELFEAYRTVAQHCDNVTLLIVGDGSLRELVEMTVEESSSIRYLGHLNGDSVWDAYTAADVLVLPSLMEPWGLVVNEAMAMGLPVIVTERVGCAQDLVQDETTGLIVTAGSPNSLTDAMLKLASSQKTRLAMGTKASERISSWTLSNQANRTVTVWRKVIV